MNQFTFFPRYLTSYSFRKESVRVIKECKVEKYFLTVHRKINKLMYNKICKFLHPYVR